MTDKLAISLAQLNPTVGDIDGNAAQVRRGRAEAKGQGADLVIYSELNICGYPPEDLVLKPAFQERCEAAVKALAAETADGGPPCSSARPGATRATCTMPPCCWPRARSWPCAT